MLSPASLGCPRPSTGPGRCRGRVESWAGARVVSARSCPHVPPPSAAFCPERLWTWAATHPPSAPLKLPRAPGSRRALVGGMADLLRPACGCGRATSGPYPPRGPRELARQRLAAVCARLPLPHPRAARAGPAGPGVQTPGRSRRFRHRVEHGARGSERCTRTSQRELGEDARDAVAGDPGRPARALRRPRAGSSSLSSMTPVGFLYGAQESRSPRFRREGLADDPLVRRGASVHGGRARARRATCSVVFRMVAERNPRARRHEPPGRASTTCTWAASPPPGCSLSTPSHPISSTTSSVVEPPAARSNDAEIFESMRKFFSGRGRALGRTPNWRQAAQARLVGSSAGHHPNTSAAFGVDDGARAPRRRRPAALGTNAPCGRRRPAGLRAFLAHGLRR